MIKALELSRYILKASDNGLSNLELQKILYFIELNYLKQFNKHLIEDEFEAWRYGPVAREVYWEYRNYGANSIDKPKENIVLETLNQDELEVINDTIEWCNKQIYWELVEKSHRKGGAWDRSFVDGEKNIISKSSIREEAFF